MYASFKETFDAMADCLDLMGAEADAEMRALAQAEKDELSEQIAEMQEEIIDLIIPE